MIATCLRRLQDKSGRYYAYVLFVQNRGEVTLQRDELVHLMTSNQLNVVNLRLDACGRIIETKVRGATSTVSKPVSMPVKDESSVSSVVCCNGSSVVTLYHGSPCSKFEPKYGEGKDYHDYGNGFYLTPDPELAKEWAVCTSANADGYLHPFRLNLEGLRVLDFEQLSVLSWLAELMKHRVADYSPVYQRDTLTFIEMFGCDTRGYDVIKGWRADASYFYVAKEFIRNNVDETCLDELLRLGDLGVQYCIRSERAYRQLYRIPNSIQRVPFAKYRPLYDSRDTRARALMRELVADPVKNPLTSTFRTIVRRGSVL